MSGILLPGGGSVINSGTITGSYYGVEIYGGPGYVTNLSGGTITAISTNGVGVLLEAGGTVTNQTDGKISGAIGVLIYGGVGEVSNAGCIIASNEGNGSPAVEMLGGGSVVNQAGGTISGEVFLNGVGTDAVYNQSGGTISGGVGISAGAASVTNAGTITSLNIDGWGVGINVSGGGTAGVDNLSGGYIGGGVSAYGGSGFITNAGTIAAAGTYGGGVVLWNGGNVTNTGMIRGTQFGAWIFGGVGTVDNANTINATGTAGVGVELGAGGTVTNEDGGTIAAAAAYGLGVWLDAGGTVSNDASGTISGGRAGVYASGGVGAVTNAGTIDSNQQSVNLRAGGTVTNLAGGRISGIDGSIYITGGTGTVTNAGGLVGGVWLQTGGTVTNQASGTINGNNPSGGYGVGLAGAGTVTNAGKLSGIRLGVDLASGGTVTNQAGATISGAYAGVFMANVVKGVLKAGGGGNVINNANGEISGDSGVFSAGNATTVTNAGSISGTTDLTLSAGTFTLTLGDGVSLLGGGTVANQTGGDITGARYGIYATGGAGTVTNAGTISGTQAAVEFAGPGQNTLTLQTGSVLIGDAIGSTAIGASDALLLQGSGTANNNFINFDTLAVQASGSWTLGGNSAIGTTSVSSGTLAITGDLTTTVDLSGGTLELRTGGIVDGGGIVFVSGGTLQIDGSAMPANVISGFAPGDTIDLSNVNYDVNGCVALSVVQTNVLTIYENGSSYNLTLDPSQSFADEQFELSPDAGGQGTDITVEEVTPRTLPPAIAAPASATLGVNQVTPIGGVSLSEAGNTAASGETFQVTLADTYSDLWASGSGVSGQGTTSLTITGSLSQVNRDLATLTDQDGTAGSDTITLNASDSFGNTAAQRTIAVTVNGLPVITAPSSTIVGVNQMDPINGVSLSETGNTVSSGETFTVTLTDMYGDLSATGSGVSGRGTTSLTITGSLSQVNSDLATLTDQDGTVGSDTITLNASDSFGNNAAEQSIAVTVNGLPVIAATTPTTILQFTGTGFDATRVFNPQVVQIGNGYVMLFGGLPFANNEQIGLATSTDGINWTESSSNPVISNADSPSWASFREVPAALMYEDGVYELWFNADNTNLSSDPGATNGFGYATSTDGVHWTIDPNPILDGPTGSGFDLQAVTKLNGQYFAYYSSQSNGIVYEAVSKDGVNFSSGAPVNAPSDYTLEALTTNTVGGNQEIISIWRDLAGISYLGLSTDGTNFSMTDTINLPETFGVSNILVANGQIQIYGATGVGNVNWPFGNEDIQYASVPLPASANNPIVTGVTATTDNGATDLDAGHVVTITVDTTEPVFVSGTPTLQLNDNEAASYASGSGTSALTFSYTVRSGDNSSDLQVTGLNLPPGASIVNGAGDQLAGSFAADLMLRVDTTPPVVTASLADDTGSSSTDRVTSDDALVGSGDANAVVHFTVDGAATTATAMANSNGQWAFTPLSLADGQHTIIASQTDAAGNTGTATLSFTLDTLPPTVSITSPGTLTNQATQIISGTVTAAEAAFGVTVTLYDDGSDTPIGTATVGAGGTWSASAMLVGDGAHSIVAIDTDAAGNTGVSSAVVYTLDTIPPEVTLTSSGGLTNRAMQIISGTVTAGEAAVGATVTLYDNGSNTLIGTATVGTGGAWSASVTMVGDGPHSIVAKNTDAAGNTGTATLSFTLDTVPPTVSITSSATVTSQATQTISGTVTTSEAAPGATVTLYDNGIRIGTATLGPGGAWSASVTLSAGANAILAEDTDLAGNTGISNTVVDTLLPTISWAANVSGNWTTAADWSPAGVPNSADNAAIDIGGSYTVTSAANATVGSLNIGYAAVTLNITGGTFTIDDGTANGSNAGTIKVEGGAALPTLDLLGVITNTASALVSAAQSGAIIDLLGGGLSGGAVNIVSGAALEATAGSASPSAIAGATVTDKGTLQASNATVLTLANATVDGTGGTIEASGAGSAVALGNAVLNGGTLTTASGGAIETIAGQDGTLDGVTISGGSTVTVANGSSLILQGTIVDDGTIAVNAAGGATDLVAAASGATLSGGGSVTLADSASSAIVGAGPGAVLTNSGDTIAGAGSIGTGDGNLTLVNKGTIDATGNTNSLVLDTGSVVLTNTETIESTGAAGLEILNTAVSNTGTIAAETGVTLLDGATIANTGGTILAAAGENVDLSGSTVNDGKLTTQPGGAIIADGADLSTVNGATVTNDGTLEAAAGSTLLLAAATVTSDASGVIEGTGAGSLVELDNATATDGTLTTANGGAIETVAGSNSTLNGVTVGSGSTVTVVDGSTLTLKGTVSDGGTIALSSTGDATDLAISGSVTLGGSGTLTLTNNVGNAIVASAAGAKLTNSTTIAGAGAIGNLGDGNLTLTNKGTIDAGGSNAIVIDTGKTVTNSGTLEATGGGLTVDDAVANSGTLVADGGNITIGGNLTGAGQAEIFGNSTIEFGGTASNGVTFASGGTGSLILDLAQSFTGTVAGLAAGNSIDLKNFLSTDTTITKVTGTGVVGTDTNVTLADPYDNVTLTLHLLNQYAGQFGISASDYALTPNQMPGNGTLFQLAASHG